jgi:hypothetical protein
MNIDQADLTLEVDLCGNRIIPYFVMYYMLGPESEIWEVV